MSSLLMDTLELMCYSVERKNQAQLSRVTAILSAVHEHAAGGNS